MGSCPHLGRSKRNHTMQPRGSVQANEKNDIKSKRKTKWKATTNSKHNLPVAPNLLEQNFKIDALNKVWVYEHVEWRTIVLVGGMYPLGLAMEKTGAAGLISNLLAETLGTFGPHITMMGVTLITLLLTQALHGAAVAVIMTPVALDTASLLGIEPKAFAVAVIVGATAAYLLPEGHPAPHMVQSPGSYEAKDYLKFGAGLVVITLVIVAVIVPLMWPF